MTATATATSQAVAEWIRIFPKGATESLTSSTTFMKQLTVVAVSTITYLKNTFPEDSYMLEQFAGIKLRILKKKCRDELAQFLSSSLIKAFEAIDKKYLHQMVLCFYDKECRLENLVEYHLFEYSYTEAEAGAGVHVLSSTRAGTRTKYTFENVREKTVNLIRTCVVIMESCQDLPEDYEVGLRLYYNDNAPADYQAPGYLPAEGADHIAPLAPHAVRLGSVATPYHRLSASTYMREHAPASHEPQASLNTPILNDTNASGDDQMTVSGSQPPLNCSCRKFDVEGELLTCQYCNMRQHASCYGVLSAARAHCCVRCSDADPTREPTDAKLASLVDKKREALCIFRRTLVWCGSLAGGAGAGASGAALAAALRLTHTNAARLLRLLHTSGVLPAAPDSLDTPQKIQPEGLKNVMRKYFQSSDLVERLAESASETTDPLGDVLSPLARVHLQEDIGRVMEESSQDIRVLSGTILEEDSQDMGSTLKEYHGVMGQASEERELRSSKRKAQPQPGFRGKRSKN